MSVMGATSWCAPVTGSTPPVLVVVASVGVVVAGVVN